MNRLESKATAPWPPNTDARPISVAKPTRTRASAEISWTGSKGARTLQLFNVQGKCNQVYRTVMGVGDINASNNIYGYMVKP